MTLFVFDSSDKSINWHEEWSKTRLPIGIVAEGCLLGTASTGGCVFTLKLYIKGAELGTLVGTFMVPESQNISERRHIN